MRKLQREVDPQYLNCPIRNVIDKFGDKWSLLVLYHLNEHGTLRFNELHRDMSDCSQKMLSQTLKRLEQIGLISRQVYPEVPPELSTASPPAVSPSCPMSPPLSAGLWSILRR